MAVAFSPTRSKLGSGNLSNNDTVMNFPTGTSGEQCAVLNVELTTAQMLGRNLYFEWDFNDPDNAMTSIRWGLVTDEHLNTDSQNTARAGKMNQELFDSGFDDYLTTQYIKENVGDPTPTWWLNNGSGVSQSAEAHPLGTSFPEVTNGDRVGMVIAAGTDPDYPFNITIGYYVNGVNYGWSKQICPGGDTFGTRTFTPALWISRGSTGADANITLVQQVNWGTTPEIYPSVVEWSASPAAPAVEDNGYCRLRPGLLSTNAIVQGLARHDSGKYSNDNLTVAIGRTTATSSSTFISACGTTARVNGKYYFEAKFTDLVGSQTATAGGAIGVVAGGESTRTFISSAPYNTMAYLTGSTVGGGTGDSVYINNTRVAGNGLIGGDLPERRAVLNDTFMIAVDIPGSPDYSGDLAKFWFGLNGTWYPGDPASVAGYEGTTNSRTGQQGPWYPFVHWVTGSSYNPEKMEWTVNFGATPFEYTIPTGFQAWDTTAVPS